MCEGKVQINPVCCMKVCGEVEVELHASTFGAVGRVKIYTVYKSEV